MGATSISDRYAKAREALATYDNVQYWGITGTEANVARYEVVDALRSLIESPPVVESPEKIAERIMIERVGEADPTAEYTTDGAEILGMIAGGIHAGIQAAWESWEPETGAVSQDDTPEGWLMTLKEYRQWVRSHDDHWTIYENLYGVEQANFNLDGCIEQDYWDGPESWAFPFKEKEA